MIAQMASFSSEVVVRARAGKLPAKTCNSTWVRLAGFRYQPGFRGVQNAPSHGGPSSGKGRLPQDDSRKRPTF